MALSHISVSVSCIFRNHAPLVDCYTASWPRDTQQCPFCKATEFVQTREAVQTFDYYPRSSGQFFRCVRETSLSRSRSRLTSRVLVVCDTAEAAELSFLCEVVQSPLRPRQCSQRPCPPDVGQGTNFPRRDLSSCIGSGGCGKVGAREAPQLTPADVS